MYCLGTITFLAIYFGIKKNNKYTKDIFLEESLRKEKAKREKALWEEEEKALQEEKSSIIKNSTTTKNKRNGRKSNFNKN
ncbi:MAG: hypothetical protein LBJ32_03050 [Oscillospiraceae bacterium]|jgi:hypothetical protein|nr:hypothetical protein [Oscillospiraceae bacterium]